jgi:hypothetical protein
MAKTSACAALSLAAALLLVGGSAVAEVPDLVSYSGRLTDGSGDGKSMQVELTVAVWEAKVGGSKLWEWTYPGVAVVNGYFSLLLGDGINPADPLGGSLNVTDVFREHSQTWVGVTLAGAAELEPRQQVTTVPYAVTANHAVAADVAVNADYATLADSAAEAEHAAQADTAVQNGVPVGMVGMFEGGCPAGWAELQGIAGRFPLAVAAAAFAATPRDGGANTHSHSSPSHAHNMQHHHRVQETSYCGDSCWKTPSGNTWPTGLFASPAVDDIGSKNDKSHVGGETVTISPAASVPLYRTLVFCRFVGMP